MSDAFDFDPAALHRAVDLLQTRFAPGLEPAASLGLGPTLPEVGSGDHAVLERLAPAVLGAARSLGAPGFFAHMDPPTPWITWAMHLWAASCNQNLLQRI